MVAQAVIAAAMSCADPMRFNGVESATFVLKSAARPGTNSVSTTPGETARTRTSGASTLASAFVMTSMPALAAQYATDEPTAVNAAIDEMKTINPSPEAFNKG